MGGTLRAVAHFDIGKPTRSGNIAPAQFKSTGSVYYSNLDNPTGGTISQGPAGTISGNGITRLVADDITGTPGGDVIEITFSVANQNAETVTCRARLRFWSANGTGGLPGTYLGSAGLTFPAFPFPPGITIAAGGLPAGLFPMPGTKFWAGISFDNENNTTGATLAQLGNMGQGLFDPPTFGSSSDVLFETTSAGSFLGVNNPPGARVNQTGGAKVSTGWKFTAVPYSVTVRGTLRQFPYEVMPSERAIPRVLVEAWRGDAKLTGPAYAGLDGAYSLTAIAPFLSGDFVRVSTSNDWLSVGDYGSTPPGVPTRDLAIPVGAGTALGFLWPPSDALTAYYIAEDYGRRFWTEHMLRPPAPNVCAIAVNDNSDNVKMAGGGLTLTRKNGYGATIHFSTDTPTRKGIVCHEFVHEMIAQQIGHALCEEILPDGTIDTDLNSEAAGLDEGLADYFTYAFTKASTHCDWCGLFRERPLNQVVLPKQIPWCADGYADDSKGHDAGQAVSGAIYDLRHALGVPEFGDPTPPGGLSAQQFDRWIFDAVAWLGARPRAERTPVQFRSKLEENSAYRSQVIAKFERHNIKEPHDNGLFVCLDKLIVNTVSRVLSGSSQVISISWSPVPGAAFYSVYFGYGDGKLGAGPGMLVGDSLTSTSFVYTYPDTAAHVILTVVPVDASGTEGNPSVPLDTYKVSQLTGVGDLPGSAVNARLIAWPTPFSTKVALRGTVPEGGRVSLSVFDVNGRLVKRISSGTSGDHGGIVTEWDGRNDSGGRVPAGVYFVQLAGQRSIVHKKVLILR